MESYILIFFVLFATMLCLDSYHLPIQLHIRKKDYARLKTTLFFLLTTILFALLVVYLVLTVGNEYIRGVIAAVGATIIWSQKAAVSVEKISAENIKKLLLKSAKMVLSPIGVGMMLIVLCIFVIIHFF